MSAATTDRATNGQFTPGNPGGPGNPYARRTAELRKLLLTVVTNEELEAVTRAVLAKAKGGDIAAARLIYQYVLGRPVTHPDPDRMELHEWAQQKAEAAMLKDFAPVLKGMDPTRLVTMMRELRPCVTVAYNAQLSQLVRDSMGDTPSPNGNSAPADVAKPARRKAAAPSPNGKTPVNRVGAFDPAGDAARCSVLGK